MLMDCRLRKAKQEIGWEQRWFFSFQTHSNHPWEEDLSLGGDTTLRMSAGFNLSSRPIETVFFFIFLFHFLAVESMRAERRGARFPPRCPSQPSCLLTLIGRGSGSTDLLELHARGHAFKELSVCLCVCVCVGWRTGLMRWGCRGSSYQKNGRDTELFSDSRYTKRGMK